MEWKWKKLKYLSQEQSNAKIASGGIQAMTICAITWLLTASGEYGTRKQVNVFLKKKRKNFEKSTKRSVTSSNKCSNKGRGYQFGLCSSLFSFLLVCVYLLAHLAVGCTLLRFYAVGWGRCCNTKRRFMWLKIFQKHFIVQRRGRNADRHT